MAPGKQMDIDAMIAVGRVAAFLGVNHVQRIGPEHAVTPLRGRAEVQAHRRAIGHRAVLINRIVGCEEGRERGEQVEHNQANDRSAYGARGQTPFAREPAANRPGNGGGLQPRQRSYRSAHCEAIEEKSTRGSTATSAISASRLPTSSSIVPINTDPITR